MYLTEQETQEMERLQELKGSSTRWFSQEEQNRLRELIQKKWAEFLPMDGDWILTKNSVNDYGIRDDSGFVCQLMKPSQFLDQKDLYESKMSQMRLNARMMTSAPAMLAMIKEIAFKFPTDELQSLGVQDLINSIEWKFDPYRSDLYRYGDSEFDHERTQSRLIELAMMGCSEVGIAQFGVKGIVSGTYIEHVWNHADEEWRDRMEWKQSVIDKKLES